MAWFRIRYSRNAFVRSLGARDAEGLSPAEGLRAMAAFYRDHRPQHAPADQGDDVLEFRWGPGSAGYELALLRRMRRHGSDDPERVLELRYGFRMTPQREAVKAGQHALDDPSATGAFVRRVTGSAAWKTVAGASVVTRSLTEA